jgi:hypothetical protein
MKKYSSSFHKTWFDSTLCKTWFVNSKNPLQRLFFEFSSHYVDFYSEPLLWSQLVSWAGKPLSFNPIRSVMLRAFMISGPVNYVASHWVGSHRVGPNGIIAARPRRRPERISTPLYGTRTNVRHNRDFDWFWFMNVMAFHTAVWQKRITGPNTRVYASGIQVCSVEI